MEISTILFWLLLVAMAMPSVYFGYTKLIGQADKVSLFKRFGYPLWFVKLVGLGEATAGIGLLFAPMRCSDRHTCHRTTRCHRFAPSRQRQF